MTRTKITKLSRAEIKERLYRKRYFLPNAVTLGSMFCGFLTIIYASSGRFEKAAVAIGCAILLDGLDGRVARKLNAITRFGSEFDSFADFISFGVAPAMLMYQWCFRISADEFGVVVSFIFALCAASRLARFNISEDNLERFEGLPTPGAAGLVAATVNFCPPVEQSLVLAAAGMGLLLVLAGLMVSKIPYLSIKTLRIKTMPAATRIFLGGVFALIWYNNQIGFFVLAITYCVSSPFRYVVLSRRGESRQPGGDTDRLAG